MKREVKIFRTPDDLAEYYAKELSDKINRAAGKKVPVSIALSGGQTPKLLFTVLAEKFCSVTDWNYVHFFWVDERCVPPDDPESNYGMARQLLMDKIIIPRENIHRMRGEDDPAIEAERYSSELMQNVRLRNMIPSFDIVILGMGDDGHTASIFPGNERLLFSDKICDTAVHPVTKQNRVTLTGKVINNANEICFLVTGIKKSGVVHDIIKNTGNNAMFPAAHIDSLAGKIYWYLDREAAKYIE